MTAPRPHPPAAARDRRPGITHVPEGRSVFANLSVRENLRPGRVPAKGPGRHPARSRARLHALSAPQGAATRRTPAPCPAASSRCSRWRAPTPRLLLRRALAGLARARSASTPIASAARRSCSSSRTPGSRSRERTAPRPRNRQRRARRRDAISVHDEKRVQRADLGGEV